MPTGTVTPTPCNACWTITARSTRRAQGEGLAGESVAAELLRVTRQIQHATRDIARLDSEEQLLRTSEIGLLHLDAEAAAREERDLLTELAASLREQIADAQRRFELTDRQISAHGR